MIVKGLVETRKIEEFNIPERFEKDFENDVEKHFIGQPIPISVLKRFCKAKGIYLISVY